MCAREVFGTSALVVYCSDLASSLSERGKGQ